MPIGPNLPHNPRVASYEKRGKKTRARVIVGGKRISATFQTKAEANKWASALEATGSTATVGDALTRYADTVSPTKRGARWEIVRLRLIGRDSLASVRVSALTPAHIADWRDRRLQEVSNGSVAREMNLIRSVFEVARREWGWLTVNPVKDVRIPLSPASRKRRITDDEIERLTFAFGLADGLTAETAMNRTGLAFLFALETAMRAGEIIGLKPEDIGAKSVTLPRTKNGDIRAVPLSPRAREILALLPDGFRLDPATRDVLFRKARDRAEIKDLRFHDSRAEAIWRLSKKLDVLELARVIGHRDLRSLMLYYQITADELADRL